MYERLLNKYAINQLGYVVEDVEKAALEHSKLFGSGPFVFFDAPDPAQAFFRGEKTNYSVRVAYGMYGDLQIELIQPRNDAKSPYSEKGIGFNHFSVWVDDFDAAVQDFKDAGFEVALLMTSSGGLQVAYIDCLEAWGHYVEIHNPQPYLVDMCRNLAKDWDGKDPVRPMSR